MRLNAAVSQVEFYLGFIHYPNDRFLQAQTDIFGWIDINVIQQFPKMRFLNVATEDLVILIRHSKTIEVSFFGTHVRSRYYAWMAPTYYICQTPCYVPNTYMGSPVHKITPNLVDIPPASGASRSPRNDADRSYPCHEEPIFGATQRISVRSSESYGQAPENLSRSICLSEITAPERCNSAHSELEALDSIETTFSNFQEDLRGEESSPSNGVLMTNPEMKARDGAGVSAGHEACNGTIPPVQRKNVRDLVPTAKEEPCAEKKTNKAQQESSSGAKAKFKSLDAHRQATSSDVTLDFDRDFPPLLKVVAAKALGTRAEKEGYSNKKSAKPPYPGKKCARDTRRRGLRVTRDTSPRSVRKRSGQLNTKTFG